MNYIKRKLIELALPIVHVVACKTANSLSMMGMYEPECPKSLTK